MGQTVLFKSPWNVRLTNRINPHSCFYQPFNTLTINHLPNILVFPVLALAAIVMRVGSFFPSLINHDESTYIVISDTILQGFVYQVDYVDTKPIGIFLIYALLQKLVGSSIVALRFMTAMVVAATAYGLFRAKCSAGSSRSAAIAAGLMYVFITSVFTFYGVSPNTELFFNLFTAAALWLYFAKPFWWGYLLVGLFLGLGFVVKYMVLFDGLAFGLFLLWLSFVKKENKTRALAHALLIALGAAIPVLAVLGYYLALGQIDVFWFYTFTVPGRYAEPTSFVAYLRFFLDFKLRFFPVTIFFVFVLWHKKITGKVLQFGLLWAFLALCGVMITGKLYGHYFIQYMLPFCFVASEFFDIPKNNIPKWLKGLRQPKFGYSLLGALILINLVFQKQDYLDKKDHPREVAAFLSNQLKAGDRVYCPSGEQIVYHLLGQLPPNRYIHPSIFWFSSYQKALEIPVREELDRIRALRPRFIYQRYPVKDPYFLQWMEEEYELVKTLEGGRVIMERIRMQGI